MGLSFLSVTKLRLLLGAMIVIFAVFVSMNSSPRQTFLYAFLEETKITKAFSEIPDTDNRKRKAKGIHVIGERHSGAQWLAQHLEQCFGSKVSVKLGLSRRHHLFQWDNIDEITADSLVIAVFLNPYTWVEAMREEPCGAPLHRHLNWKTFVTRTWSMPRWGNDLQITNFDDRICTQRFRFHEVVPCSEDLHNSSNLNPFYEMKVDGIPYESIVDLRQDKIDNFLNTSTYQHVMDTWPIRQEDLAEKGTNKLLRRIEEITGETAQCEASIPLLTTRQLSRNYVAWMNRHVDWTMERRIGYNRQKLSKSQ